MTDTLVTLAHEWNKGHITLTEAAERAADLEYPVRKTDTDGEVWFDGEQDNTTFAVYETLDTENANIFLNAVAHQIE